MGKKVRIFGSLPFSSETVMDDNGEIINVSSVEMAGTMLSGKGWEKEGLPSKVISVRLNVFLLDFIDFIVERSGKKFTRNELVVSLLKAGIASGWETLSEEEREEIFDGLQTRGVMFEVDDLI